MKGILKFLLFFFFACNSDKGYTINAKKRQEQSIIKEKYAGVGPLLSDTVVHAERYDLYGLWTDGSTENATEVAVFEIPLFY